MKYVDPRNPWLVVLIVALAILICSLPALIASPSPAAPTSTQPPNQQAPPSLPPEPALTATSVTAATPSQPPVIAYQPTFESAPCAFPVPRGYAPECGYLIVPENRARPDSRQIRLHVAIFRSRAGTPSPDPVLKISGGPGS